MDGSGDLREKDRIRIRVRVRELRTQRRWTQAELAERLGLSQSRLSEIEGGQGSFTAEQFLTILRLFNAPLSDFSGGSKNPETELQNSLARLGADHLRESTDVLPSEHLSKVGDAIREALLVGDPRLLTALAPVLVRHADGMNLGSLGFRLAQVGLERRLGWVVENTLAAIRERLAYSTPRQWTRRYRRAEVVLESFLNFVYASHSSRQFDYPNSGPDVLDRAIRTKETLNAVTASSSAASKSWNIITSLQPRDFEAALRAAEPND
jgi:transcriptional regulator with XRE-family HTH domain